MGEIETMFNKMLGPKRVLSPAAADAYTQFQPSQPERQVSALLSNALPRVGARSPVDIVYCAHDSNPSNKKSFKELIVSRDLPCPKRATDREQLEEMYRASCAHLRSLFDVSSVRVHLFEGGHKILRFAEARDYGHLCDTCKGTGKRRAKLEADGWVVKKLANERCAKCHGSDQEERDNAFRAMVKLMMATPKK